LRLISALRAHAELLKKSGTTNSGVGCIYLNVVDAIDLEVLEELIQTALKGK